MIFKGKLTLSDGWFGEFAEHFSHDFLLVFMETERAKVASNPSSGQFRNGLQRQICPCSVAKSMTPLSQAAH